MRTWLDLLTLKWLTGDDGYPAFFKLAHLSNMVLLAAVIVGCFVEGTLAACIGWLFAWAVLLAFSSHGIKGLTLYAKYKAGPAATLNAQVTADLAKIAETIAKRRDNKLGIEPSP